MDIIVVEVVFWLSIGLMVYAYFGYPLLPAALASSSLLFQMDAGGTGGILRSGTGVSRHQAFAELRDVAHSVIFRHGQSFNSRCLVPLFSGRTHRVVESV